MTLSFRQWLDENVGPVVNKDIANTAAEDGFDIIPSKYMSGQRKLQPGDADPKKVFGKMKKKMKKSK